MSSWDATQPAGTEKKALGAKRIRDQKAALQDALSSQGIFPGSSAASPVFIPTIQYGPESGRPAADPKLAGRWYYNTDQGRLERDNGVTWDPLTENKDVIPTGTAMIFFEAAAPTGWTQVVTGIDDRMLRVTAGAVTGGTATAGDSVSSPPTHTHGNTGNSGDLSHTHPLTWTAVTWSLGAGPYTQVLRSAAPAATVTPSVSLAHAHSTSAAVGFSPKYQDIIVCTRN